MWNYGIIHLSVFLEFLKKIFSISVMCKMNTQKIQKKIILLKSAHRVQYVVKWAHGVPKIDTPYYTCLYKKSWISFEQWWYSCLVGCVYFWNTMSPLDHILYSVSWLQKCKKFLDLLRIHLGHSTYWKYFFQKF